MKHFTQHQVIEMDESKIQHCVICGEVISDYSNVMFPEGQGIPKGFPAGDVFVSNGNPTELRTGMPVGQTFSKCTVKF